MTKSELKRLSIQARKRTFTCDKCGASYSDEDVEKLIVEIGCLQLALKQVKHGECNLMDKPKKQKVKPRGFEEPMK